MPLPRSLSGLALVVLCLGCSVSKMGARVMDRQAHRAGLHEATLETSAATVRYWTGGPESDTPGEPVLLLHGFGGDGLSTWRGQIDPLLAHHQVIVPDLLWFGGSIGTGPPTLDAQADAMGALLDALHLDKVTVVGISYGGFVTLRMALSPDSHVGRMVIVDSPGNQFSADDEAALFARFGVKDAAELMIPQDPQGVQTLLDLTTYKDRRAPTFVLKDLQKHMFSANKEAQTALLADLPRWRETMATLPPLPPTMLIWGEFDEVFPLPVGQRLAAELSAPLTVIEQSAHAPNIEKPGPFNAALVGWLDGPVGSAP